MVGFKFDWDSSIEVGIPKVDLQHQELFKIARNIEQILMINCMGITNDQLLHIIGELRDYVTYHFYEEEIFMQQINYPQFLTHRQSHEAFKADINKIDIDDLTSSLQNLKDLLQNWFFDHILIEDKAIKTFLMAL
ncbi:bacteriohemerythrin [Cellulosilyticum sp. I15G10I2]|uniref:bacteriohemerythrin n=1 Tax=Cellulosilyticum sp. I15G10I2 TaxID=1892843 RepID=UPI00085CAC0C|nr:hemerythrin family protein [Cellulosilyticum sp. I15G10I2]